MNDLSVWDFEGYAIRTIEIDGAIWWVLADVCKVLEITHTESVAERLDEDEVTVGGVIDSLGRKQNAYIINEAGLYTVIIRSDKPKAKPFRKWVTHEVLPAIRAKGYYTLDADLISAPAPTVTSKAYAYLDIARMVSRCRTERLPLVLGMLKKGGWEIPDIKETLISNGSIDVSDIKEKITYILKKYNLNIHKLAPLIGYPYTSLKMYYSEGKKPKVETYINLIERLDEFDRKNSLS